MNDLVLGLLERSTGISADHLIAIALVRALSCVGWSLLDQINPNEHELAELIIHVAQREGIPPRQFVNAAICDLMNATDPEAELIKSHPPSTAVH